MSHLLKLCLLLLCALYANAQDVSTTSGHWHALNTINAPTARMECGYVRVGNYFYLVGGRGVKPVQAYNPGDSVWLNKALPPVMLHHFQAVEWNGLIYVVCGFTGTFPVETPLENIYIYDPVADAWLIGPEIPVARRRGAAGCVVYNNKIYVAGGLQNGHLSGWVSWLDCFDPATNTWTILPDAPHMRDHFQAAVYDDKIYCISGRLTGYNGSTFNYTVPEVDIYDISENTWSTLPATSNLPTPRAGSAVCTLGDEIIVIGGESQASANAHKETEALNVHTHTWRALANMTQGRQATQAIAANGDIYIACGSSIRGNNETNTSEQFYFFAPSPPPANDTFPSSLVTQTPLKDFSLLQPDSSRSSYVTLSNILGNQVIYLTDIKLDDTTNFKINLPSPLPILVAPNVPFSFTVTFNPSTVGLKIAELEIIHTGANASVKIPLKGECVTHLPCALHPTENNGLLVFESESATLNSGWQFTTEVPGYAEGGYIQYIGPNYTGTPGKFPVSYKFNINTSGLYRFQMRSWQATGAINDDNDMWVKFPDAEVHKYQVGVDKGIVTGWFKVYQNTTGVWTFHTKCVEENPHDVYVKFDAPGTYELVLSGRINSFRVDRFVLWKSPTTEAQATTDLPFPSDISCVTRFYYADADGDSYGNPNDSISSHAKPAGYADNKNDCDDNNIAVFPGAAEINDGLDNNCSGIIDEGFGAAQALFLVGNENLGSGDLAIKSVMEQLGMAVFVKTPATSATSDANGMSLIFISATVNSGEVGTKFTNVAVPVINCEPYLSDDLKMTLAGSGNMGSLSNATQVNITGAPHALAAGLSNGITTVYSSADKIIWGVPSTDAIKIATLTHNPSQHAIFAYEKNDTMAGMVAPARRAAFFLNDFSAPKLNASGLALLEAVLTWASASQISPTAAITNPLAGTTFNAPANILISADASHPFSPISKVEFYNGQTLLHTDFSPPYSFSWNGVIAGNYVLFAKAYTDDASAFSMPVGVSVESAISSGEVLFVVGALPLSASDAAIAYRLENSLGFSVTAKTASSSVAADASGKSLILISSTVNSADIKNKFTNAAVPLINWEYALYDDLKMASSTFGNATAQTHIEIVNAAHPLAGALPAGSRQVYSSADKITWARPAASAINIASVSGNAANICIFGYEAGAAMAGMNAPARRVGFFMNDLAGTLMNVNGFALFDAAVVWAANVSPVNEPPVFTISGETTFPHNFSGTKNIVVIPSNPAPGETVTYALFPSTCSFANVSINSATGTVSVTAVAGASGTQQFTITADDGNATNNTYSQEFTLTVQPASVTLDCNGVQNGTAFLNECGICVGGNTGLTANAGKDCNGVCFGTAVPDNCGVCGGNNSTCGCNPLDVVSLTLMRAGTAGEIGPLTNGMTLNKSQLGAFSIRADVCDGNAVKSVQFKLNNTVYRTENSAPYAINGDKPTGSYTAWNPAVGTYTLTVTAYSQLSASGVAGIPVTVTFEVVAYSNKTDEQQRTAPAEPEINVYPNPSQGNFSVEMNLAEKADFTIEIFTQLGQTVYSKKYSDYVGEFRQNIELNRSSGIYLLRVQIRDKWFTRQVAVW